MGVPITLVPVGNLTNNTSAQNNINNNSAAITTGFSNTVDINGDTWNGQMNANNNHLINLPAPASNTEPLRVIDATTLNGGGIVTVSPLPSGGTTGQILAKHSNTNFDAIWENPPVIASAAIGNVTVYTGTSTIGGATDANISNGTLTLGSSGTAQGEVILQGVTSGSLTITTPVAAGSSTLTLPAGTTDFSSTGGANQVVKQSSSGGALTVGQLSAANLSNGTTGTGAVVLANNPTFTASNFLPLSDIVQETQGYSLLGNPTAVTANYTPFQLGQLTNKTGPTGADLLLIADNAASGALKYSTVSQVIGSTVSGVTSINSEVGVLTLTDTGGGTITSTSSNLNIAQPGGNVNRFRNGSMDVWQRGTTISSITTGSYTADGWKVVATGAAVTATQQAGRGPTLYSLRVTGASSVTNVIVEQPIESYMSAVLTSQIVTVQAQVYNNTGGTITPTLTVIYPNSQDNYSGSTNIISAVSLQACPNAQWTQVSYVYTDTGHATNGTQVAFNFGNNFASGSNYIEITECDIRVTPGAVTGATAVNPPTPELRPIQPELALCQRYLYQITGNFGIAGFMNSATVGYYYIPFPVPMRSQPTGSISAASDWSNASSTAQAGSSAAFASIGVNIQRLQLTSASFGSTQNACFLSNTSGSSYLRFTAEI